MGTRTIVNGYVFSQSDDDAYNREVLETFPFDAVYPLRAVFSAPRPGYGGSIVAFADAIKAGRDDWQEWRSAFEGLLGRLRWREAQASLAESEAPAAARYAYVLIERTPIGTRVARFEGTTDNGESNEVELVL